MMRRSTFHLPALTADRPSPAIDDVLRIVTAADELGYHGAWITEHHGSDAAVSNPLLLLAHLAARTERIRLGTSVLPTPLWPTRRLVEDLTTCAQLLGDRLRIGLGQNATGRAAHADDADDFEAAAASVVARLPEQGLWEAAVTDDGIDRVIARGHHLICSPPLGDLARVARLADRLHGLASGPRQLAATAFVVVHDDPTSAIDPSPAFSTAEIQHLDRSAAPPTTDPERLASRLLAGPAPAIEAQLRAIAEAGVDEVLLCSDVSGTPIDAAMRTLTALAPQP
ncbi:MAG: LLM class flavin-dependent oxidoreductase [Actinomycetota bacterium]